MIQSISSKGTYALFVCGWFLVMSLIYVWLIRFLRRGVYEFALSVSMMLGCLSLVSVVGSPGIRLFLVLFLGSCLFFLASFGLYRDQYAAYAQKPIRRAMMMMWVFVVFSSLCSVFAFTLFFPTWSFLLLSLSGAFVCSVVSFFIWQMYTSFSFRRFFLWLLVVAFIMIEIMWVMRLLPFGYLLLGFLATWVWYVMQLLLRFHFSPNGIMWKKQFSFLLTNGLFFIVFLIYLARWV
ncbi:MAG: hypothetical protein HOC34_00200 [Candidatus Magasanikbacteria bacterium]|nr:hypothetical protein [Candidatus Magasanikbacteria bacterium]MBT4220841.1 hypothetical protein [Candidatus Magasanikbacteria bacterium]MBT4350186.1 hypothetical protein [Candidatus Magasanikbacteria bacterium]MBT4541371.1 hypothetical protein [Candidatus Magasanikbacteria bacterium]MBT6253189.1 hypothetical protein [Candidatus Magasanikbacteria bacterium]